MKDTLMKVGGKGFLAFAHAQPDTPGKLTARAFSYEHLEVAAYDLLARVAEQAGDEEVEQVARQIRAEEQQMADRLAGAFDRAVAASLREVVRDDLRRHLDETCRHQQLVADRLEARNAAPSTLKDLALRTGALNWALFFRAHPDTPGKLAAFAYAFEHLEIGSYEELKRVAERAGDRETVATADEILGEERAAAEKLSGAFDRAAAASLAAVGVSA
jgi:ferritin-like metal-binding protein YciE